MPRQRQREIVRITCGSSAVDQLLGGGLAETKCITEMYGEFRCVDRLGGGHLWGWCKDWWAVCGWRRPNASRKHILSPGAWGLLVGVVCERVLGSGLAEAKCITEMYGEFRWAGTFRAKIRKDGKREHSTEGGKERDTG